MMTADGTERVGNRSAREVGRSRAMPLGTLAFVLGLVASIHLAIWALKNPATTAASVEDRLASVSYNRFVGSPSAGRTVPDAQDSRPISRPSPGKPGQCALMLPPRGWSGSQRLRLNSGLTSRLAPGSARTMPETSVRSHQRSIWPGTTPMSRVWSWAMKLCFGRSTPQPNWSRLFSA